MKTKVKVTQRSVTHVSRSLCHCTNIALPSIVWLGNFLCCRLSHQNNTYPPVFIQGGCNKYQNFCISPCHPPPTSQQVLIFSRRHHTRQRHTIVRSFRSFSIQPIQNSPTLLLILFTLSPPPYPKQDPIPIGKYGRPKLECYHHHPEQILIIIPGRCCCFQPGVGPRRLIHLLPHYPYSY